MIILFLILVAILSYWSCVIGAGVRMCLIFGADTREIIFITGAVMILAALWAGLFYIAPFSVVIS